MKMSDVLDAIRAEPGVRLHGLRATFQIPTPDEDEAQWLAYYVQQLDELGIIHQDHGGWYAVPDTHDSVRQAKREAAQQAIRAARVEARLARQEAATARTLESIERLQARLAAQPAQYAPESTSHLRARDFDRLTKGMTLRQIATVCGRSVSAAQSWRDGRSTPPEYAINALLAATATHPNVADGENVTDLI